MYVQQYLSLIFLYCPVEGRVLSQPTRGSWAPTAHSWSQQKVYHHFRHHRTTYGLPFRAATTSGVSPPPSPPPSSWALVGKKGPGGLHKRPYRDPPACIIIRMHKQLLLLRPPKGETNDPRPPQTPPLPTKTTTALLSQKLY